jgi:signal transduction histidine kinase
MRLSLVVSLFILIHNHLYAQQQSITSFRNAYLLAKTDSSRQLACLDLIVYYNEVNRDSALYYIEERLTIARRSGYKILEASVLNSKGYQKTQTGKYAEALQCIMASLTIAQDPENREINLWKISPFPAPGKERLLSLSGSMHQLGLLSRETDNPEKEVEYFKKAVTLAKEIGHADRMMVSNMNVGSAYLRRGILDSALYFALQADSIASLPEFKGLFRGRNLTNIGDIYFKKGDLSRVKPLYLEGLIMSSRVNNQFNVAVTKHKLAQLFLTLKQSDSALYYAKDNLSLVELLRNGANFQLNLGTVYQDIYLAYRQLNQKDSAYKYLDLAFQMKDSLYKVRLANLSAFQNVSFDETLRLESLEREKIKNEANIRLYSLLSGLIAVSLIGLILYRNNIQRTKSNKILQSQKDEIELQNKHVEEAMEQLKSTQSQLIQSEKMASLGELTAGIAHEIQNPLNFVNNFSELSAELIEEMNVELNKGDTEEAKVIAADLKQNLEKITHHGKRADAIVKGMLQHSQKGSGQKEPTNINALADEYLRLAYHGLRAKDKDFNATMKTDLDASIGNINIIPQDIGRVLLNLINNALYAVNEKKKHIGDGYEPQVTIRTKLALKNSPISQSANSLIVSNSPISQSANSLIVSVADNGNGISETHRNKIFQPFFTTKPTGQGTGLGLSLSYDIVKAHGGELRVETKQGEGSTFIIWLPFS